MKIKVKKLNDKAKMPVYASAQAAGMDLSACIDEDIVLNSMQKALVPTGIAIEIPENYAGMIYPRSGLAVKYGLTLSNCVGVIDSDYRGEIKCGVINLGDKPYTITDGERIAQMVITHTPQFEIELTDELNDTQRGEGGFGSTGKK